jgi:hypothetical protein
MLSTLVFPFVGQALRKGTEREQGSEAEPPGEGPSRGSERPLPQPQPAA